MLQSMVSQRVGHDLATERQKHTETIFGSFYATLGYQQDKAKAC